METIFQIPVKKTLHSKLAEVNWKEAEFGKYESDHMFTCTYKKGQWNEPAIVPFQNLSLSPTTLALHYGQSVFEGMKAFKMKDGSVSIFRMEKHHQRLNRSLHRMCMPSIPFELFASALDSLVHLDRAWVPEGKDAALYIRPFVFASEAKLGVKVSEEYSFIVVTGPVPALYPQPIKVKVERKYIRAAKGGTGAAKCSGNYGAAFYPTQKAREEGFHQVIWTDAFEHEFIEESGTMNLMFVIDGRLVTPAPSDSILDGVTRDSLLEIAQNMGIETEERPVSIHEIMKAFSNQKITEAFGAGTAAVVAPISTIGIDGQAYHLPAYSEASLMYRLKKELESIRTGNHGEHEWNWRVGEPH